MIVIYNWIKKGKDIYGSCITADKKGYHSHRGINSNAGCVTPQKNPSYNTVAEPHHNKTTNNGKGNNHHAGIKKRIRVLIAESNHDLGYLYQTYLDSYGLDVEVVDGGEAVLDRLYGNTGNSSNYDIVVINTHLFDMPGLDAAKEILKKNPSQKIVITTSSMRERLSKRYLDSVGIDHECVLTMPFRLSDMMRFLSK